MNFIKYIFVKVLLIVAIIAVAAPAVAQDKLASVAPIDRKMRAIDSVALRRLIQKNETFDMPSASLYPTWNNKYTTNYGVALPAEYKIDLRHFHMPCDSRLVTSHFGYRSSFHRNHYGTDIKVFIGDTIRAAFSGKVRMVDYEGGGYGKYIVIRHANGLETLYGHMSKQLVKENDVVKAGEPIGLGGNTGRSTGSHLHFETRFLGQFIDPERMFDFAAQDVKADYYIYHSHGRGVLAEATNGEEQFEDEEMVESPVSQAEAKEEESREFQQEKIAKQKSKQRTRVHKVKSGENLYVIARKRGTTVDKLCKINKLDRNATLRPGQILKYS